MSKLALAAALVVFLAVTGCTGSSDEAAAGTTAAVVTANSSCPMKPKNSVDAKTATMAFEGETIGFCCADCLPVWNKLDDKQKRAKLAKVGVKLAE